MRRLGGEVEVSMRVRNPMTIRLILREHGVRQTEIASSWGVSTAYVSLALSAKRYCSPERARWLVGRLGGPPLTVDMLFETLVQPTAQSSISSSQSAQTERGAA